MSSAPSKEALEHLSFACTPWCPIATVIVLHSQNATNNLFGKQHNNSEFDITNKIAIESMNGKIPIQSRGIVPDRAR